MHEISILMKKTSQSSLVLSTKSGHSKKEAAMNQEEDLLWTSQAP